MLCSYITIRYYQPNVRDSSRGKINKKEHNNDKNRVAASVTSLWSPGGAVLHDLDIRFLLRVRERSEAVLVLAEDQGGPHLLVKAGGVGGQGGRSGRMRFDYRERKCGL